jgi:lycopene beta-cyclase
MIRSGKFADKKILIVDKEEKVKNDRTWCFWENEPGLFEPIVAQHWKQAWFHANKFSRLLNLTPYQYKLIRGIDFYKYCFNLIRQHSNIHIRLGEVKGIESKGDTASLLIGEERINGRYIFNSIIFDRPVLKKKEYYLLQHFKGWVIETDRSFFNPREATLMDFRTNQDNETTFVYVMPFSETKALIEHTVFSEEVLPASKYDEGLKNYIEEVLQVSSYKVTETEFGIIPMTNHQFSASDNNIINIGTAGGQTKASSGYTFRFIQKHSAAIVDKLLNDKHPVIRTFSRRFHFYDSILLNILKHKKLSGERIFSDLFRKNKPQRLLWFLDNESSFIDELRIISSLPTMPFLKAGLRQL